MNCQENLCNQGWSVFGQVVACLSKGAEWSRVLQTLDMTPWRITVFKDGLSWGKFFFKGAEYDLEREFV